MPLEELPTTIDLFFEDKTSIGGTDCLGWATTLVRLLDLESPRLVLACHFNGLITGPLTSPFMIFMLALDPLNLDNVPLHPIRHLNTHKF